MPTDTNDFDLLPDENAEASRFPLTLLALGLGIGGAMLFAPAPGSDTRELLRSELADLRGGTAKALARIQSELRRRRNRARRRVRFAALAGMAVGAGLAALLTPASGPDTRRRIAARFRETTGAASGEVGPGAAQPTTPRSVDELGRKPEQVF